MEVSQSDAGTSRPQEVDQKLQMSTKPLHRFIKGEPKSLGVILKLLRNILENRQSYRFRTTMALTCIFFCLLFQIVILLLGCAEFLMGLLLLGDHDTSVIAYVPFWQGVLVSHVLLLNSGC